MKPWMYDLAVRPLEALSLQRLRRRFFAPARGTVLELGTGTGLDLPHYAPACHVVATDVDPGKLSYAKRKAARPRTSWVVADAERLPFRETTFDTVSVAFAFCTIPDPERALREVRRVLALSGRLRVLEHVRHANRAVGRIQDLATPVWKHLAEGCHLNRDTLAFVREAGFEVEREEERAGGLVVGVVARPAPPGLPAPFGGPPRLFSPGGGGPSGPPRNS